MKISKCCRAKRFKETDLCLDCGEHAEFVGEELISVCGLCGDKHHEGYNCKAAGAKMQPHEFQGKSSGRCEICNKGHRSKIHNTKVYCKDCKYSVEIEHIDNMCVKIIRPAKLQEYTGIIIKDAKYNRITSNNKGECQYYERTMDEK
ncbi:hypothetical protein LCGC14_0823230 [marine sediment metagenome]|uniref:Uncharacterized protein n=1 Tax=marine sediment metagenome TaxID=412755 RepID=A0A0F9PMS6_9ZZZZ|nr:hypothetical protein [Candidatus Scalindua sp.]